MTHTVTFPWAPKELSPNARGHWSVKAKHAKAYKSACFYEAKAANVSVDWEGDVHVWLTFFPPDRRHRDDDNVYALGKYALDGLALALKINDKRFRLHPYVSEQIGGKVVAVLTKGPQ